MTAEEQDWLLLDLLHAVSLSVLMFASTATGSTLSVGCFKPTVPISSQQD